MLIKSVETAFLAFLRSFYVFSHWQHQLFLYRGIYSDAGEVALQEQEEKVPKSAEPVSPFSSEVVQCPAVL